MISILRTDSKNLDFINLVAKLDADLGQRDGEDHDFYHQFNGIDTIKYAIILYEEKKPIGCGAIKVFDTASMEVKRMYVIPNARGKGLATKILSELELWATELGFQFCILETGKKQPEAIALYQKNGYDITINYGQYEGIDNSVCFKKRVPSNQ